MTSIELRQVTGANRPEVEAITVAREQERFVGTVAGALADAAEIPEAKPWYRAIYLDGRVVGFVMIGWNVEPDPPYIIGPWFLWKLLVDHAQQGRGVGRAAVRLVTDVVRAEGATELLTSYVEGEGGPAGFYERLGFRPTGQRDGHGEVIVALDLTSAEPDQEAAEE